MLDNESIAHLIEEQFKMRRILDKWEQAARDGCAAEQRSVHIASDQDKVTAFTREFLTTHGRQPLCREVAEALDMPLSSAHRRLRKVAI